MKYFLSLILFSLILLKTIIVDLEKKGRSVSKYIQHMPPAAELNKNYKLYDKNIKGEVYTRTDMRFTWEQKSLSFNIPTLTVSKLDDQPLDYQLTLDKCEDCLIPGLEVYTNTTDITCSLQNGKLLTSAAKETTKVGFKKEVIVGDFLFRLTEKGFIEVSEVYHDKSMTKTRDLSHYVDEIYDIYGLEIKDFYIYDSGHTIYKYSFVLLVDDKIISLQFYQSEQLNFRKNEIINLKDLEGIRIGDPIKIEFIQISQAVVLMKNGIYKLDKVVGQGWTYKFITKVEDKEKGVAVELVDMDGDIMIINENFHCIIVKKGFGLLMVDVSSADIIYHLEHPFLTGLQKHNNYNKLQGIINVGVFVDNQKNEDVKEFFLEFIIDVKKLHQKTIFLSRVFISSKVIKASQTTYDGTMMAFLTDSRVYLTPMNLDQTGLLPIYFYKTVGDNKTLGFLSVRKNNSIIFRLANNNKEENFVILSRKSTNEQYYKCIFASLKNYLVTLSHINDDLLYYRKIHTIKVVPKGRGDDDKKPDPKDDPVKPDDGEGDVEPHDNTSSGEGINAILIVVIVVIILVVIAFFGIILYIRYKRRQHAALSDNLLTA
jgi:hypothetical protein